MIHESKDQIKTSAKLIDPNRLEMAYDAPKRFFNDIYKTSIKKSEKDLELYWEVEWLKYHINN